MSTEVSTTLLTAFGVLLASALVVAAGVYLLPRLKDRRQGYPFEAQIEAALLPFAFQAICGAYRLSEWGLADVRQKLTGADKKRIADAFYDLLPERIGDFDLALVKRVVTRERWRALVQNAFDRFNRDFVMFQEHYAQAFADWCERYNDGEEPDLAGDDAPAAAGRPPRGAAAGELEF